MRPLILELDELRNKLLEMGGLVESSLYGSVRSLVERDAARLPEILAAESRINELDIQIDELATRLLARQQPVARDLRFVTAALKINSNLERMGDLAVNIARRSLSFLNRGATCGLVDIPLMSKNVAAMVRNSLDALVQRDEGLARTVLLSDDEVDDLKEAAYRGVMATLESRSVPPAAAFDLIFIAHNLERIADHATNIAEDVMFMITGRDVRHKHTDVVPGFPGVVESGKPIAASDVI
jgi:phosphate transport system protein